MIWFDHEQFERARVKLLNLRSRPHSTQAAGLCCNSRSHHAASICRPCSYSCLAIDIGNHCDRLVDFVRLSCFNGVGFGSSRLSWHFQLLTCRGIITVQIQNLCRNRDLMCLQLRLEKGSHAGPRDCVRHKQQTNPMIFAHCHFHVVAIHLS